MKLHKTSGAVIRGTEVDELTDKEKLERKLSRPTTRDLMGWAIENENKALIHGITQKEKSYAKAKTWGYSHPSSRKISFG
jgi:hypothetical protein